MNDEKNRKLSEKDHPDREVKPVCGSDREPVHAPAKSRDSKIRNGSDPFDRSGMTVYFLQL